MALGAIAAVALGLRLLWVIVQDLIEGNHVVAPGYPEEPAGPDIARLVMVLFFLFVAVLAAWYYLRAKPEPRGRKKKQAPPYFYGPPIPPCDGGIPPAGLPPSSPPGVQSISGR
jgi:hypothetical protein